MTLEARAAFALALWDLGPGDGDVLLASSASAHALLREAPPITDLPDVVTPWLRVRAWATAHRDVPVAPPLSLDALEEAIAARTARGLVLVDRGAVAAFASRGSLARAFVFAARGKKAKLRLDRVQNALVREAGAPEPVHFKQLLRRTRANAGKGASSDDGKKLAAALLGRWEDSDVELTLTQKPMK